MSGYKKKIKMTHQQGSLGGVLQTFMHQFGEFCVLYHQTIMFTHRENGVYQQWTMYSLESKSVLEMHFPAIWRSKFTDLANKTVTKLNLWEKTALDKSAWIKACYTKLQLKNELLMTLMKLRLGFLNCLKILEYT